MVGDINYESAGEVAAAIGEKGGGEAMAVKLDVTDSASIQAMVDKVLERFGTIDVLVNNAGITADAQLVKMNEDQWDRVIAVNLKGVYNCTKAIAPHHDRQGFRQNHKYILSGGRIRQLRPDQLRCHQSRRHWHDKGLGQGTRAEGDHGERRSTRVHNDRDDVHHA